jgi:transposase
LSYHKPCYRDLARDEQEVEHFVNDTFPRIHRLADKMGADIGFEDEAGMGLMRRSGRTWGRVGSTPVVQVVIQRGGYNVLSIVTPKGEMNYSVTEDAVNSQRYIEFLGDLIHGRPRPLILIVDQAPFHGSQKVREWVRAHRSRLRIFFLPKCSPELNPDEQVWNEIKNNKLWKTTDQKQTGSQTASVFRIAFLTATERTDPILFPIARHTICLNECLLIS